MFEVLRTLWQKRSFRHLTLAAALHSVVWYASGAFNNAFLQRSHQMSVGRGRLLDRAALGHCRLRHVLRRLRGGSNERSNQRPAVVLWVPGIATLLCVPFQFLAYLSADRAVVLPSFVGLMFMAAVFFGPSFAMTQALATLRMRSVATSLLLFIQTLIGYGLGPSVTGLISDRSVRRSSRTRFATPWSSSASSTSGPRCITCSPVARCGRTWRQRRGSRRRRIELALSEQGESKGSDV